jgi:hypothetical protein
MRACLERSTQLLELRLEDHDEITLGEGLFEETQSPSDTADVERLDALAQHVANIFDVLRSSRQHFRHDQILGNDHRDDRALNLDVNRSTEGFFFQAGSGKHDIQTAMYDIKTVAIKIKTVESTVKQL